MNTHTHTHTRIVKEQLGDVEESVTMEITDGVRSFLVQTCRAISFKSPGSVVVMVLDRRLQTLTFTVNQSPAFVLTGAGPCPCVCRGWARGRGGEGKWGFGPGMVGGRER